MFTSVALIEGAERVPVRVEALGDLHPHVAQHLLVEVVDVGRVPYARPGPYLVYELLREIHHAGAVRNRIGSDRDVPPSCRLRTNGGTETQGSQGLPGDAENAGACGRARVRATTARHPDGRPDAERRRVRAERRRRVRPVSAPDGRAPFDTAAMITP